MDIKFIAFASIMMGMSLVGLSVGFILGYYFQFHFETYFWAYLSAPCLGIGSGLIIYGTLKSKTNE